MTQPDEVNGPAGPDASRGAWPRDARLRRGLCALAVVAALGLYCLHITGDLYADEGHSFRMVSAGRLLENLKAPETCHPPLYFASAKLGYALTGQPWGIRLPSVLASVAAVILCGLIARRLLGEAYVLPAVVLAAFSPMIVEFAAEGRPYAMLIFFTCALMHQLLRFVDRESVGSMCLLALVAVCGFLTHYIFAAHLLFAAGYYLVKRRRITRYALGTVALFTPVALYLIWGAIDDAGYSRGFTAQWRQEVFRWGNFIGRLPFALTFGYCTFSLGDLDAARNVSAGMIRRNWPMVSLSVIAFAGLAVGVVSGLRRKSAATVFALCGIVAPIALALLGGRRGFYLLREKYMVGVLACYIPLLAIAIISLARWKLGWLSIAAYCVVAAVSLVHYAAYPYEYSRRTNRSGLNAAIVEQIKQADCIVSYRIHRKAPWYLTVLDGDAGTIDLKTDRPEGVTFDQFARQIDQSCEGTVFVISREADRNRTDPKNTVFRTLSKTRQVSSRRFGRNLALHVFRRKAEAVAEASE